MTNSQPGLEQNIEKLGGYLARFRQDGIRNHINGETVTVYECPLHLWIKLIGKHADIIISAEQIWNKNTSPGETKFFTLPFLRVFINRLLKCWEKQVLARKEKTVMGGRGSLLRSPSAVIFRPLLN